MSNYKGHVVGASVFFVGYLFFLSAGFSIDLLSGLFDSSSRFIYVLTLLGICILFGLWPDVDTNSKAQNIFYSVFLVLDLFLIANGNLATAAYLGLFALLPIVGKHRGWTHTWWAMLLIPSPLFLLPYWFYPNAPYAGLALYGAAVAGYLSHLVLDRRLFR